MIRPFEIKLKPDAPAAPEIPDIDQMTAQETPVHAADVIDATVLKHRVQKDLAEARERAVWKIKNQIELRELYSELSEN